MDDVLCRQAVKLHCMADTRCQAKCLLLETVPGYYKIKYCVKIMQLIKNRNFSQHFVTTLIFFSFSLGALRILDCVNRPHSPQSVVPQLCLWLCCLKSNMRQVCERLVLRQPRSSTSLFTGNKFFIS